MTVTATYDPVLSRVRLSITGLGLSSTVLVERSSDGIRWSTVRGAAALPVSGGVASVDDYEFTPGVANTYRATPGEVVETFESATLTLTITGTWARADDWAYEGAWAYKSAPILDGETTDANIAVPAGATTCEFKWKVSSQPGSDYFRVALDGVEQGTGAAGEFEGFTSGDLDVSTVTTVTARYVKAAGDGSAGLDAAWIDNVRFWGFPTQQASITPGMDTVWIKNVARPFLNREVTVVGFSEITRPSRGGVFDVVGRTMPVAVTDVRGSRRFDLTVAADTVDAATDLDLCFAAGDPVLLHVPDGCPFPGMYAVIGDVTIARRSTRGQRRYLTLPLTEVAAPGVDIVGATATYQSILNAYATYSALLAGEASYEDAADRVGTADEVIVP